MTNPYAPPTDYALDIPVEQGSYGLGVALGFLLGLWGLLGCLLFAKAETKRGSRHGFLARLGVTVFIVMIVVAAS